MIEKPEVLASLNGWQFTSTGITTRWDVTEFHYAELSR